MLTRGQVSKPSSSSTSRRPPDYVYHERRYGSQPYALDPWLRGQYRRWSALQEAYSRHDWRGRREKKEDERGILERVAGLLDKPYEWVTEKGSSLVSWLAGKSMEKKARGENVEGFAFAVGASAVAFITGTAAGITGLISPRAWSETVNALLHPIRTFNAVRSDPLAWAYILGSVIGPGVTLRFPVRVPRTRVYELGRVGEWGARLYGEDVAVELPSGRVRGFGWLSSEEWGIYVEARGEAVPVKARLGKPKLYDTGWARARLGETEVLVREGLEVGERRSKWYYKGRVRSPDKTVRASIEVTVEKKGRGYIYTYKSYIEDPESLLLKRRPAVSEIVGRVLENVKPRIEVYDPIVLRVGLIGVAGVPRVISKASGHHSMSGSLGKELLGNTVRESGNVLGSWVSLTSPAEAVKTAGHSTSATTAANTSPTGPEPPSSRGRPRFLLPVKGSVAPPLWHKKQRRRAYYEIVYPEAILPL